MLADIAEVVIGVDTHKDTHTAAVLDTRTGGVLADRRCDRAHRLVTRRPLPQRRCVRHARRRRTHPRLLGKAVRDRLNRCGNRQLNRALHTIVLTRMKKDKPTQAYADRRRAQGKTDRESNATSPESSIESSKQRPQPLDAS